MKLSSRTTYIHERVNIGNQSLPKLHYICLKFILILQPYLIIFILLTTSRLVILRSIIVIAFY